MLTRASYPQVRAFFNRAAIVHATRTTPTRVVAAPATPVFFKSYAHSNTSPSKLILRPLKRDEVDRFVELCIQTYQETYLKWYSPDGLGFNETYRNRILPEELQSEKINYTVATLDKQLIGYYKVEYAHDRLLFLDKIYLLQRYQSQGFGKQMLLECCYKALKNDCHSIRLITWIHNRNALAFYGRYGFIADAKKQVFFGDCKFTVYPLVHKDIPGLIKQLESKEPFFNINPRL